MMVKYDFRFDLLQMFLSEMNRKLSKHNHYTSRGLAPTDKTLEFCRDFRITHYAGTVVYGVLGFLDKNRDTLFQDFKRILYNRFLSTILIVTEGIEACNGKLCKRCNGKCLSEMIQSSHPFDLHVAKFV